MNSERCLRCMAVFTVEGGWRPLNNGSAAREYKFRGSVVSKVLLAAYVIVVALAVYAVDIDRHTGGMWSGLISWIVVLIVGLPTNLLLFAVPASWWQNANSWWIAWCPVAFNLFFLCWLAFTRRKERVPSNNTVESDARESGARGSP